MGQHCWWTNECAIKTESLLDLVAYFTYIWCWLYNSLVFQKNLLLNRYKVVSSIVSKNLRFAHGDIWLAGVTIALSFFVKIIIYYVINVRNNNINYFFPTPVAFATSSVSTGLWISWFELIMKSHHLFCFINEDIRIINVKLPATQIFIWIW